MIFARGFGVGLLAALLCSVAGAGWLCREVFVFTSRFQKSLPPSAQGRGGEGRGKGKEGKGKKERL